MEVEIYTQPESRQSKLMHIVSVPEEDMCKGRTDEFDCCNSESPCKVNFGIF